jgi:CubicO group peptidase (beta-lactamase class C family)
MRLRSLIPLFGLYLTTLGQAFAQASLATTTPEKVGMSAPRLLQIDRHLQNYIDKKWVAGAVAIVARNGSIVYHKSLGQRDAEAKVPMQKDDIFRIASMTKPIVSLAVMMLYEENRFNLDDPVSLYIPEFKTLQVLDSVNTKDSTYVAKPTRKPVTIRQLLSHTSGIGYNFVHPNLKLIYAKAGVPDGAIGLGQKGPKIGDKMKLLATMPLLHQPGERWTYGLSTDMLGYLVEVVSGQSLADFLTQRIFGPLGMSDTHFGLPAQKAGRLVKLSYENEKGELLTYPEVDRTAPLGNASAFADFPLHSGTTYFSGGSGLVSTAMDYLKFVQMLLNGGELNGARLVSRKTVELMTTNQIGNLVINAAGDKFGLGLSVPTDQSGFKMLGAATSFGWGGAFTTSFWFDKKEKIAAVLMTQIAPTSHGDIADKFKVAVYQAIND